MSWNYLTEEQATLCEQMTKWMTVAKQWGGDRYKDWVPTSADIHKSALFERIRSGKEPLKYPPPLGFSCPWYALVEDRGPHFVGSDVLFKSVHFVRDSMGPNSIWKDVDRDLVFVCQHMYRVVDDDKGIIRDEAHPTPYRFKLWHDPNVDLVAHHYITTVREDFRPRGGWFIQNVEFIEKK